MTMPERLTAEDQREMIETLDIVLRHERRHTAITVVSILPGVVLLRYSGLWPYGAIPVLAVAVFFLSWAVTMFASSPYGLARLPQVKRYANIHRRVAESIVLNSVQIVASLILLAAAITELSAAGFL
ncbi:hypothetical protein [Sphingopyxis sp.]|uniref:hypothetical protein n=1 Tax=Sphingopyxis sp. TaxID=1908224 RepID=UPI003F706B09